MDHFGAVTNRQKAAFRLLTHKLRTAGHLNPIDALLVKQTALVWVESERLQKYCDKYGTTYEVVGRSGDVYTKHRPEHQQLVESRTRLLTLLKELGATPSSRKRVEVKSEEVDPLGEILMRIHEP